MLLLRLPRRVAATIKVKGVTYKVTAIGTNAFKNCKKVKKISVGKNVKTIGKNAFKGCKKTIKVTAASKKAKKAQLKKLKKSGYKKFK